MSCCTPDGSWSTGAAAEAVVDGRTTVYNVAGMTCGHCKATLMKEIGALSGVLSVEVDLSAGQVASRPPTSPTTPCSPGSSTSPVSRTTWTSTSTSISRA